MTEFEVFTTIIFFMVGGALVSFVGWLLFIYDKEMKEHL